MKEEIQLAEGTVDSLLTGFTAYGIERQNSNEERHLPIGQKPWQEARVEWMSHILYCAAKYQGMDPESVTIQLTRRLEGAARHSYAELADAATQQATLRALHGYISALAGADGDHRRQLLDVRELLTDMFLDRLWGGRDEGVSGAREKVDSALVQVTARQPIRFTRVLLGPETGPCESGFVSGSVVTPQAVRDTEFYRRFCAQHPERKSCPALCVTYAGCGGRFLRDASEFDLSIIQEVGDRFLNQTAVKNLDFGHQLVVRPEPKMEMNMTM